MKYDLTKKITKGARRTLDAFFNSMLELLSNKSFEEITVNELCQQSNYPRATFYNYFDDKYDLLNYCLYVLAKQIHLEEYKNLDPEESLYIFFDRMYDLITARQDMIQHILKFNSGENLLLSHFQIYMNIQMREIFCQCQCKDRYKIPYEIVAEHYCNTILLILEWSFLKKNSCSKIQAHEYLKYLLRSL
ncbi:TetR/AcrR family transcriptional regulator [Clostridium sp. MT-14]|uniref:TetR/AcrR family transcriptional regulator n=1 Tax=Clostridium sp. MT-14 TaxID=3348360 RepID=UPI0035F3DE05